MTKTKKLIMCLPIVVILVSLCQYSHTDTTKVKETSTSVIDTTKKAQ